MALDKTKSPTIHASECAKRAAVKEGQRLIDEESPASQECQYMFCGSGVDRDTFIQCDKVFSTSVEKANHVRSHVRSMEKTLDDGQTVLQCYFVDCAVNPGSKKSREGTVFTSEEVRLVHLWDVHRVTPLKADVQYCELCGTWLTAPHEWSRHAHTHLEDVQLLIKESGFGGIVAGRQIVPRFCPFCYDNPTTPISGQLRTFLREVYHRSHIVSHLVDIRDRELRVTCPCYPRLCSSSVKMTALEVMKQLAEEHQVPVLAKLNDDFVHQPRPYAKRTRRTEKDEVADSDDSESDVAPLAKKQSIRRGRNGGKNGAKGMGLGEALEDVE